MCGIVGGIGNINFHDFLIDGIKALEYRGYDSSGIAYKIDQNVYVYKEVGRVKELEKLVPSFTGAKIGIAHTRWATHGVPSRENAHPQFSQNKQIYIVHNGVILNYKDLKNKLIEKGYSFVSGTDTEVVANLLEDDYQLTHNPIKTIYNVSKIIDGSYAILVIFADRDELYFMKNKSPLVINSDSNGVYFSSDFLPLIDYSNYFVNLSDNTYGYATSSEYKIYKDEKEISIEKVMILKEDYDYNLNSHEFYMHKEIFESSSVIERIKNNYTKDLNIVFSEDIINTIRNAKELIFLSCGSSYYASLIAKEYFDKTDLRVSSFIASEWAYNNKIHTDNPVFILISQSGETGDLIDCLRFINEKGYKSVAITNRNQSTIYNLSTYQILLHAGLEVAVAATKSFIAQVYVLKLLRDQLLNISFNEVEYTKIVESINDICSKENTILDISRQIYTFKDGFFVGKGFDYLASLESALKLKEVSYIHTEAYPSGELKHGPIALIKNDVPVIAFISNKFFDKSVRNNLEELKSRGALTFIVSSTISNMEEDNITYLNVSEELNVIPEIIFGQLLSYNVAKLLNREIDKPKNLAKSVTVI